MLGIKYIDFKIEMLCYMHVHKRFFSDYLFTKLQNGLENRVNDPVFIYSFCSFSVKRQQKVL